MGDQPGIKHSVKRILGEYKYLGIFGLLFGIILYSLLMTHGLTNTFDGLWHQNYHRAGSGELSSGRWLLVYLDKLVMGNHADPMISLLTLGLYVIGFVLVADLFRLRHRVGQYLCMALFLSSTVICITLSYRYTALGYGLAYFFAVLSIYIMIRARRHGYGICIGGIFLGLAMACYQAYLAVFCIVAVMYWILLCKERAVKPHETSPKAFGSYLGRILAGFCVGMVFYYGVLQLCLRIHGVSLSSYNGVGQISLGSLLSDLPHNIMKTYRYFYGYFFMNGLKINSLQSVGVFYLPVALVVGLTAWILCRGWKTNKKGLLLLLPAVVAIPVACSAYMLLAGDKLEMQMTAGLAMLAPLILLLGFSCLEGKSRVRYLLVAFCVVLTYGSAMQVWLDQESMYEGQNACDTMMTQVVSDLAREDLLSAEYEYFFVGVPADNGLFAVSEIYGGANAYARLGDFWVSGGCGQASYRGLINGRMGLDLPIPPVSYEEIAGRTDVSAMAVFPYDGYITLADEKTVVIKISEYKPYAGTSKYVFD